MAKALWLDSYTLICVDQSATAFSATCRLLVHLLCTGQPARQAQALWN